MDTAIENSFSENLLNDVKKFRSQIETDITKGKNEDIELTIMPPEMVKHWLNFAVYYEKAAAVFIGQWLKSTPEDDALLYFSHQIEDEATHYRLLKKHLGHYTANVDEFVPPAEWKFLMEDYYPNLPTLIERLAAHNIAAETGALGFAEAMFSKMPQEIQKSMTQVIKDERYHVSFGMKLLDKYCVTDADRALATQAAFESMEHMKIARSVFVKI